DDGPPEIRKTLDAPAQGAAPFVGLLGHRVEAPVDGVLGSGGEDEPFAPQAAERGCGLAPGGFAGQGPEVPDFPELLPAAEENERDFLEEVFREMDVANEGIQIGVERPAVLEEKPGSLFARSHRCHSQRRVSPAGRILIEKWRRASSSL